MFSQRGRAATRREQMVFFSFNLRASRTGPKLIFDDSLNFLGNFSMAGINRIQLTLQLYSDGIGSTLPSASSNLMGACAHVYRVSGAGGPSLYLDK